MEETLFESNILEQPTLIDYSSILEQKLEYWMRKLLDLSNRNNLIKYKFTKSKSIKIADKSLKSIFFDLSNEPNIYLSKNGEEILFNNSIKENLSESIWKSYEDNDITEKKLYNLYLKYKENFEELGLYTCFAAIGSLKYKDINTKDFNEAPIFLCPIELERSSRTTKNFHKYCILPNFSDIQINVALMERLFQDFEIKINIDFKDDPYDFLPKLKLEINNFQDWEINEEIYLDIFNYQKYVIYEDLKQNKDFIKKNPLIRTYIGEPELISRIDSEFKEKFNDSGSLDILPADSSQKFAIELAKLGHSFVLQGPPGTGKSQTIVNIIAALIAQNKKVLFVSQKMAALEVVNTRLKEIGLDLYCLNLHSFRGNKKEIITQLMNSLINSSEIPDKFNKNDFSEYLLLQKDLNDYYKYLCCSRDPWNISIFNIRGEISKLEEAPNIFEPLNCILKMSFEDLVPIFNKIEQISNILEKIKNPFDSLYIDFLEEKGTDFDKLKFKKLVDDLLGLIKVYAKFSDNFFSKTKFFIENLQQVKKIFEVKDEIEKFDQNILEIILSKEMIQLDKFLKTTEIELSNLYYYKDKILTFAKEGFIDINTEILESQLSKLNFITFLFNKEYKETTNRFSEFLIKKINFFNWKHLINSKKNYIEIKNRIDIYIEKNKNIAKDLGDCFDLKNIKIFINNENLIKNLSNELEKVNILKTGEILQFIFSSRDKFELNFSKEINAKIDDINSHFKKQLFPLDIRLKDLKDNIAKLIREYNDLNHIMHFRELYSDLNKEIQKFIDSFLKLGCSSNLFYTLKKSYYLQILSSINKVESQITPKEKVEKFVSEDNSIRDLYRYEVISNVERVKPKTDFFTSGDNEVSILKREYSKKKRLKPVRELLELISNLAFILKPCFMMSPLTVSQYINSKLIKFDTVIFDEASQILPEDAVTCLARANQAIIMGDIQQLPPTTFFYKQMEDDSIDDDIEDLESFLGESSVRFDGSTLDWHYRSLNENLIAYSNKYFYSNRLITFPNPKIDDYSGIEFIYVKNAIYDRSKSRQNKTEAEKITEVYTDAKKKYPGKSIGIIAFSISQESAIRQAFIAKSINIEDEETKINEEVFIKNLETVQGDERDIIILSVGYGKDINDKLSYNFGPINRNGGFKRLNVAITRSRLKVYVACSFLPNELDDSKINSEGLRYLKDYLLFAQNRDFSTFIKSKDSLIGFQSSFEDAVFQSLKKEGLNLTQQIGCSGYRIDIGITNPKNPKEYVLGIECDGSKYYSSKFARDRDKIRQEVLQNLGWNIYRIWSDDWINDSKGEIEKIIERYNSIIDGRRRPKKIISKSNSFTKVKRVEGLENFNPYDKFQEYQSFGYENVKNFTFNLETNIVNIINFESPIEKGLIIKRLQNLNIIGRATSSIVYEVNSLLDNLYNREKIFIYQETISSKKININSPLRISNESERPFDLIPKEELATAIIIVITNVFSISRDSLIDCIAKEIFNFNRVGQKIESKIDESISYLLSKKIILIKNNRIEMLGNNH